MLGSKDDMEIKPIYAANQYWKTPDMYDLDELMAEADEDNEKPKEKTEW